jgi:hypothetical protein
MQVLRQVSPRPCLCKPKPLIWTICDYRAFAESSNLSKHLRTHTGVRPYACAEPGCGKSFARPDQLTRHSLVHKKRCPSWLDFFSNETPWHFKLYIAKRVFVAEFCKLTVTNPCILHSSWTNSLGGKISKQIIFAGSPCFLHNGRHSWHRLSAWGFPPSNNTSIHSDVAIWGPWGL